MEQSEIVGNMLSQAAKPAGWVLLEQPGKKIKNDFAVEGPVLPALRGQMKGSDWKTSGGVGWSLILLGSLRLPHVLDRDYDRPAKQKNKKRIEKRGQYFFLN